VERFARAAGWPVLADPISGVRGGSHAVSTYEALLRNVAFSAEHLPDVVLRIGAPLTSKVANVWLSAVGEQIVVDPDDAWLDPTHTVSLRAACDAGPLLTAVAGALESDDRGSAWVDAWLDAERVARGALDAVLDAADAPFEGVVARDLAATLEPGATLVVASSLPVRALEWCMAPRSDLRVLANRGANGIDGFVSTVAGIATGAAGGQVVGLCGDLSFLHDTNGLLGASAAPTLVVVDNDGGGIFSFLPQEELPEFEALFGTPHGLDLVAVARAHGATAMRVDEVGALPAALASGGAQVLVVPVDRGKSVERHRAIWSAVTAAVERPSSV
ncbi:MAG: thiamine pyrophosphate-dependent enzyme, partial [Acidimicrobiia bacterium]